MSIETFLSQHQIAQQVEQLANQINQYYQTLLPPDQPLVVLVILKGSAVFYADLIRKLKIPVVTEFISVSSYGNDMESSGQIRFELDTRGSITDRHVLIVEDIIDTGNSLHTILNHLEARKPRSLEIVTLLSKPSRRVKEVSVKFIGFTIPDKFVVGYGMDYAERYRELPEIGVLTLEQV